MTEPVVTRGRSGVTLSWPSVSMTVNLSRVRESHGALNAELLITNANGILTQQSINLLAGRSRGMLAKELASKHPLTSPSWDTIMENVCVRGLVELRKGDPVVVLQPEASPHVPFLLNPLIYQGHQTLIYAPGGSCKSFLALYLSLLVCHGASQSGLRALRAPVLYLDWELDAQTIGTRLTRLHAGHPELSEYAPYYRACTMPLHEEVDLIAEEVERKGVKLVIIDSAIMACGDDLNTTQAPKQLQRALRTLGCASLVLSHVAKNTEDKTAYGNVFFQNLCRNQYEVQLVDENPTMKRISLTHRKINFGAMQPMTGLAFDFTGDACRVSHFDPEEEEDCLHTLPLPNRIRNLLEDGEPRSSKQIADELGAKLPVVKFTLSKHRGTKWTMVGENRDAKWTVLNR